MKYLIPTIFLSAILLASNEASESTRCWGSCDSNKICLSKCDEQVIGIGQCKSQCDFTNPLKGRVCIESCIKSHVFNTTGLTEAATSTASTTITSTQVLSSTAQTLSSTPSTIATGKATLKYRQGNCFQNCSNNAECLARCGQEFGECKE
ncbi:hypothetical protein K7432_016596 [Basidiobolus ranarum]|uniref:Uncharacterized protein n=1 Tax=Basidiobolus ranarum TaxID=34480 RepID=A0ABR2WEJ4_9FUNG